MLNEIKSLKSFRDFINTGLEDHRVAAGVDQDEFWGMDGHWSDQLSFMEVIEDAGWRHAGSGSLGVVFYHPKHSYVIKVFLRYDRGYSAWINWCLNNQSNTYVPKIRGKPMVLSNELAAVRVEKLYRNPAVTDHFNRQIHTWFHSDYRDRIIPGDVTNRRDFLRLVGFVYGAAGFDHDLFLGTENIMARANGQPVVTDPLGPDINSRRNDIWDKLVKIGK